MAKPNWVTQDGSLGKIEEGVYYQLLVEATDPDGDDITFKVISGYLPPGLVLDADGNLYGQPRLNYKIDGVPYNVNKDVTSSFCIRASATDGKISDKTFSITVTGQDTPVITNTSGSLATILTGEYTEIQIDTIDDDNDVLVYDIIKGSIPEGMTLDASTGKISGYPMPYVSEYDANRLGWNAPGSAWGEDEWGLNRPVTTHKNYEFTLEVTDGKEKTDKIFSILVLSKSLLKADSTYHTVDDTQYVTADMDTNQNPIMLTQDTDLGIYEHNNYFTYKFEAIDIFNSEPIGFEIESGSLPPGLVLNTTTGWVYGYIPNQTISQTEYNVSVRAYKISNPTQYSNTVELKLTVVSNLYSAVNWISPSNLGTITTGELCNIAIESTNTANLTVNYYIYPRENTGDVNLVDQDGDGTPDSVDFAKYEDYTIKGGQLPQGLVLQSNGLLIGRPSFEYTTYDSNDTTLDVNVREAGIKTGETTFDRDFNFTIVAESLNSEIRAHKDFKVTVTSKNNRPYESLYLKSNLTKDKYWQDIVLNTDIFPQADIYRTSDPNFGIQLDAKMLLISGLSAKSSTAIMTALDKNHYRKVLKFGKPQVAKSYLLDKTVEYEVVYYEIVDDQNSKNQETISTSINLSQQINNEVIEYESKIPSDAIVYPNSLEGMRSQLTTAIGLVSNSEVLPNWMKNRQPDGSIIGWKPVVVLSYMKPGTGERALFNLGRRTDIVQRNISFDVDRYILDNNLSKTYDNENEEYYDSKLTTFDNISGIANTPVTTVDFAVDVPFSSLHGKTTAQINAAGGLDRIITAYQDKLIIFAKQEDYADLSDEFEAVDGWLKTTTFFDGPDGFDATGDNFDAAEIIPGYQENFANPAITNQRAGVWKFIKDSATQLWYLEFQSDITITNGDFVRVNNGFKYGGTIIEYSSVIDIEDTVPDYEISEIIEDSTATTFDNNNTKFINQVIVYQAPDVGDMFLPFPKTNIWE